MTKRMLLIAALAAGVGVPGCSDDTKPTTKDVGTKRETSVKDIYVLPDSPLVTPDKGTAKPDTTVAPPCTPFLATANSGKVCQDDTGCATGETCISNDAGTSGSCVGKCCWDDTKPDDDPANLCPVPDAAKQKAFCYWEVTGEKFMACAFICSYTKGGQTTTYTCPNATDVCVKSTADPNVSYCDPK